MANANSPAAATMRRGFAIARKLRYEDAGISQDLRHQIPPYGQRVLSDADCYEPSARLEIEFQKYLTSPIATRILVAQIVELFVRRDEDRLYLANFLRVCHAGADPRLFSTQTKR